MPWRIESAVGKKFPACSENEGFHAEGKAKFKHHPTPPLHLPVVMGKAPMPWSCKAPGDRGWPWHLPIYPWRKRDQCSRLLWPCWRIWWLLFTLFPAITLPWCGGWILLRFPAEELPPGTELIGKLENHHRTGPEYPEVHHPAWPGLGARRGKWGVFVCILHVLGFCCWAHPCPALVSFEVPSFRLIKIKTMGDLSYRTFPSGVFSLRLSCSSSGTSNMCSYKIAVPMKSQVLMWMETKINLLLFSSMTIPSLYFWIFLIHFHFK